MKDKQNKKIRILAKKITDLENEMRLGKNIKENESKIYNIMSSLSLEDMLLLDEYIRRKKLIK